MNVRQIQFYIMSGLLVALFITPFVSAVKEVKTISYFGGFVADALANTPYSKNFTFVSPDGVEQLYYMKARFRADMTTTDTRFYVKVDDEYCDPNYYDIPSNEKNYEMIFDCTDVAHGQGEYEAGFQANKDVKNVYGEWEFTYKNNPEVELENIYESTSKDMGFFGTEYVVNESGKIFLQLLDENRLDINNAFCSLDVYYPNNTKLVNETAMMPLGENGLYYYDLVVPSVLGVYMLSAFCKYPINNTATDDFECHNWDCGSGWNMDWNVSSSACAVVSQYSPRGSYHFEFDDLDDDDMDCDAYRRFDVSNYECNGILSFWAKSRSLEYGDYCYYYYYNGTQDIQILNYTDGDDDNIYRYYSYDLCDYGISPEIGIRVHADVSSNVDDCYIDDIIISVEGNESLGIREIKGAGEMHVSSGNVSYVEGIVGNLSNIEDLVGGIIAYRVKFASGTEYMKGTEGLFAIQFTKTSAGNPVPINDADYCNGTFYYPNKSIWLDNVPFEYLNGSNGIYVYNTTVPDIEGVYTVDAVCYKSPKTHYDTKQFHIAEWIRELNSSVWNSGNLTIEEIENAINNSETNIINEVNQTGDNIISVLNYSIYDAGNYIIVQLNDSIWNRFNMLNATMYGIRDYLNTSIWDSGDDIKINITQRIVDAELFITTNVTKEIYETEQNLNDSIYKAKYQMLDNITLLVNDTSESIKSNLTQEITDAEIYITANLTAEINSAEQNIIGTLNSSITTAENNIITRIEETETALNTSLYEVKHQIIDELNASVYDIENNIIGILNSSIYDAKGDVIESIENNTEELKLNITGEIDSAKNEILVAINTSELSIMENMTLEIDGLNVSLYEVKHQLMDNITWEINNATQTILIKVEDSEDDVIDEIQDARDQVITEINSLENNITLQITNTNSLIIGVENNLTIHVTNAKQEILNAIANCCNLTQQLLENVSLNITAQCNPKEIWKYFYANPLKTGTETPILTGSMVATRSNTVWLIILMLIVIISMVGGTFWWKKRM